MKILHFISSGGLFGAEQVMLSLSRYAKQNGIEAVIGAIHDQRDPHLEIIEKARREALPTVVFKSRGLFDINTVRELRNFLTTAGIDVLHTHNYKSDFLGLIAAKMAKIPVVATAHGFTDMTRAVTFYEKLDRWLLFSFFDRVVVVTSEIFPRWRGEGKKVIANGIDIHPFTATNVDRAQIRARYGMKPDDFVIATVGRLSKEKNQALLIKAFMPLAKENSRVKLLIIGDGPQRQSLKSLVTQLGLTSQVIFTGIITETAAMYHAMDIFALSSLTEGVPITILEAMASKVAVVATKVGGIPDIIRDTETGLLVTSQDANGLTQALNSLITDKSKRQMLTAAAFDFVRANYSLEQMGQAYQKVYTEVLH
ncbi:MAG: glycosyltransferase [Nitrospirota bacterium]